MPAVDRKLHLRSFLPEDEAAARLAHSELAEENFPFLLGEFDPDEPWATFLARLEANRHGRDLPAHHVAASFLAADVDGRLVGRASIRHELNDFLLHFGGHIGYAVRPGFRRRGYAIEILRQSLGIADKLGIQSTLVICDDGNAGSATVIERCGGVLENVVPTADGWPVRRYWITTDPGPSRSITRW